VALGLELEARPFAKSTLQLFRSQLIIHEEASTIFKRSLELARQTGLLKGRKMKAAVDTTVILGRGAVEDTYNLIAEGIVILCRALAQMAAEEASAWAAGHGLCRYFDSSIKTSEAVTWDDAASREAFLSGLIRDGQRCLQLAQEARVELAVGSAKDERIMRAAQLLTQLLWQDVEPTERGHRVKPGTERDRVPSDLRSAGARPGAAAWAQEPRQDIHGLQGRPGGGCGDAAGDRGGGDSGQRFRRRSRGGVGPEQRG
jgi:hypothetical protein